MAAGGAAGGPNGGGGGAGGGGSGGGGGGGGSGDSNPNGLGGAPRRVRRSGRVRPRWSPATTAASGTTRVGTVAAVVQTVPSAVEEAVGAGSASRAAAAAPNRAVEAAPDPEPEAAPLPAAVVAAAHRSSPRARRTFPGGIDRGVRRPSDDHGRPDDGYVSDTIGARSEVHRVEASTKTCPGLSRRFGQPAGSSRARVRASSIPGEALDPGQIRRTGSRWLCRQHLSKRMTNWIAQSTGCLRLGVISPGRASACECYSRDTWRSSDPASCFRTKRHPRGHAGVGPTRDGMWLDRRERGHGNGWALQEQPFGGFH